MEEMKGTLSQNAMEELRSLGRACRHSPGYCLFGATAGVVYGVLLGKGILVPVLNHMWEEDMKNRRMNVKDGNLKSTDA